MSKHPQTADSAGGRAVPARRTELGDRIWKLEDAKALLSEALKLEIDTVAQGELNYRLGFTEWKMEENDQAERYLRVARDQVALPFDLLVRVWLGEKALRNRDRRHVEPGA